MGTKFSEVYDFLLARTDVNEWAWTDDYELLESDWEMLLRIAIQQFMFPRVSLAFSEELNPSTGEIETIFENRLTDGEKLVLATYMKHEWLRRSITNWKNIEQLYYDKDFKLSGKAAHLANLIALDNVYEQECKKIVNRYHRRNFDYTKLAGARK